MSAKIIKNNCIMRCRTLRCSVSQGIATYLTIKEKLLEIGLVVRRRPSDICKQDILRSLCAYHDVSAAAAFPYLHFRPFGIPWRSLHFSEGRDNAPHGVFRFRPRAEAGCEGGETFLFRRLSEAVICLSTRNSRHRCCLKVMGGIAYAPSSWNQRLACSFSLNAVSSKRAAICSYPSLRYSV